MPLQHSSMFNCDRQKMRLTVQGCARLWTSARENRPAPWEGRYQCIGCPIGAKHCGVSTEEITKDRVAETFRSICPRCQRRASRLINGHLCISCYNRAREVARGRNGKGNPPRVVAARLHSVVLAVSQSTAGAAAPVAPYVALFPAVTSRTEAMILAARKAGGRIDFGPPHLSLIPCEAA